MTATIDVHQVQDGDLFRFEVVVREGTAVTRHDVTMKPAEFEKLTAQASSPEHCIKAAFRFLLDREPKEAILAHFDIAVIARYFPDFPHEFRHYLAQERIVVST